MKRFHITYYKQTQPSPILAGVTLEAINILDALHRFPASGLGVSINDIKYIIEL